MKFEIRVYDTDENGNEVDVSKKTLNNRADASDYVMKFQAEPVEYPEREESDLFKKFQQAMGDALTINNMRGVRYLIVNYRGKLDVYHPGEDADYEFKEYSKRCADILYYGPDKDEAKRISVAAIDDGVLYFSDIYSDLA